MAPQLLGAYPHLADGASESALALVHSRFSTNTFPSWELAHPYRVIAHNGRNQHAARQRQLDARAKSQMKEQLGVMTCARCCRSCARGGSDSANFDNVLELLVLAGRSLPHALMMMIPEAYEGRDDVSDNC